MVVLFFVANCFNQLPLFLDGLFPLSGPDGLFGFLLGHCGFTFGFGADGFLGACFDILIMFLEFQLFLQYKCHN